MIKKVNERILAWKDLALQEVGNKGNKEIKVNRDSLWRDILLALKMTVNEAQNFNKKATKEIGIFTEEEKVILYKLPYYGQVIDILRKLPNHHYGDFFGSELPNGDTICFLRRPKLKDATPDDVAWVDVTIVTKLSVPYNLDVYTFIPDYPMTKNITIGYATEVPQEWLEEKQKWEQEQKQFDSKKDDCDNLPEELLAECADDVLPF